LAGAGAPTRSSANDGEGPGRGHNDGPPLDDPPEIPEDRPPDAQIRNAVIKCVARWLLRRGVAMLIPGAGEVIAGLQLAEWIYESLPYINAYLDKPKTLDELNDAVDNPQPGYEIHHVAEQTAARDGGFPESQIDARENKVRISTLKHWQITGWYMTKNEDFGGIAPRDYLQDKGWAERERVGLLALRAAGVLRP
jgi:hypothetical protein